MPPINTNIKGGKPPTEQLRPEDPILRPTEAAPDVESLRPVFPFTPIPIAENSSPDRMSIEGRPEPPSMDIQTNPAPDFITTVERGRIEISIPDIVGTDIISEQGRFVDLTLSAPEAVPDLVVRQAIPEMPVLSAPEAVPDLVVRQAIPEIPVLASPEAVPDLVSRQVVPDFAPLPVELPAAPNMMVSAPYTPAGDLSSDIQPGQAIDPGAYDTDMFTPFNGRLITSLEPSQIGVENYKTLQNYRYGKSGLEAVLGWSKINTTKLTAASFTDLVFDTGTSVYYDTITTIAGDFIAAGIETGRFMLVSGSVWNNLITGITPIGVTTTVIYLKPGTVIDEDATGLTVTIQSSSLWDQIIAGSHLFNRHTNKSFVLVQALNSSTPWSDSESFVKQNIAAIPSAGNFEGESVWKDTPGVGLGRFSLAPAGSIAYCNGKESCIWNGDEMPCSAVFLCADSSLTSPQDVTDVINNSLDVDGQTIYIGQSNDTYTKYLYHCDALDAGNLDATVGTDATLTGAVLNTHIKRFGASSLYLDGFDDYATIADSANLFMGTGAFTLEGQFFIRRIDDAEGLFEQFVDVNNFASLFFKVVGTTYFIGFQINDGGTSNVLAVGQFNSEWLNTLVHIALIRGWGGAADALAITVNGVAVATGTFAASTHDDWPDFAAGLDIGRARFSGATTYASIYIDEIRICKGIARWTSNFSPPTRPYGETKPYALVLSTRKISGVKFYVKRVNINGTLELSVWTGNEFTLSSISDGTSSGGVSLAQNGTVIFNVSGAKPRWFQGLYLYAYLFRLSGPSPYAEIYEMSLYSEFQKITDIWDGVYLQPIAAEEYHSNLPYGRDKTVEINIKSESWGSSATDTINSFYGVTMGTSWQTSEYALLCYEKPIAGFYWKTYDKHVNNSAATMSISYWDGAQFSAVALVNDGTAVAGVPVKKSGMVWWNPPMIGVEQPTKVLDTVGYAYKVTFTASLHANSSYQIVMDTAFAIPAPVEIRAFKFPMIYKNMLMLCGYEAGGQGNRVDYCLPTAPNVWNGDNTSDDGRQSLYFGGSTNLTAGIQLFNRFGDYIQSFAVLYKDREMYLLVGDSPEDFKISTVSLNIGCPCPATLDTAEVGAEVSGATRNVAIWLSHAGPMIFDGSNVVPIGQDIANYFNPAKSECINYSYLETAIGCYDPTNKEYHVIFPSGAAATVPNTWLIYQFEHKKWWQYVPDYYPRSIFKVQDAAGGVYLYAGLATGFMVRVGNGPTFNSLTAANAIAHVIETGDFFPSNNPWDTTIFRHVKVVTKKITEAINMQITHYPDTKTATYTTMASMALAYASQGTVLRNTQPANLTAWAHRFKFVATTTTDTGSLKMLGWGGEYGHVRKELRSPI